MYRNILFVGDVRPAKNYGAIATTEAMLDLIHGAAPDAEVKIIDSRSFSGQTPVEGWGEYSVGAPKQSSGVKSFVRNATQKVGIYSKVKNARAKKNSKASASDPVPARLDKYPEFAKKVTEGQAWAYEKKLLEWAEVVIVQGEGNIVNGTDAYGRYRIGGRYILFISYLAKYIFKKPCYILNHTVDPQNRDIKRIIREIYPKMDGIYVREKKSLAVLEDWGVVNATYVPDALWTHDFEKDSKVRKPAVLADFDFSRPYICIGDSSGISNKYTKVKWDIEEVYTRLIRRLKKICPNIIFIDGYNGRDEEISRVIRKNGVRSVNLENCNYHELYYVLSGASLFVSGRWHASIIALLGHTPVLLWGSDSHKTEALYGEVDYGYEFFDVAGLPLNTDRVAAEAKKILKEKHETVWSRVSELQEQAQKNVQMLK